MDIKLRARLSAYSKIDSIDGISNHLPLASEEDAGAVLGVGADGRYTLFPTVEREQVDEMFIGSTVTHSDIDSLFDGTPTEVILARGRSDVNSNETENIATKVNLNDIDSLFS